MKKFLLKLFPHDKLLHFTFVGVLPSLFLQNFLVWWLTLIVVLVVAIAIEVADYFGDGEAERMDIVYALIGYVIVMILTAF